MSPKQLNQSWIYKNVMVKDNPLQTWAIWPQRGDGYEQRSPSTMESIKIQTNGKNKERKLPPSCEFPFATSPWVDQFPTCFEEQVSILPWWLKH